MFSGIEFTVDEAARGPEQLALTAPVCVLVEAKNENIVGGIPQCLAEMVAARRFNLQRHSLDRAIHGIVTTGMLWRFLSLDGTEVSVDAVEYPIQSARKIFGILTAIALEGGLQN